jgi:hypothetical protein
MRRLPEGSTELKTLTCLELERVEDPIPPPNEG